MLRRGSRLGKYRIEARLAQGGFAIVYKAFDTVEGILVALKVPHPGLITGDAIEDFRSEVRLTARLDHPNVLPIKDANFIDGTFVIVSPLGLGSLGDRLTRRLAPKTAIDYGRQLLQGLAHAHEHRIIHCDIKPENLILFSGGRLRLSDFGIARFALRTMRGSGSGTIGFVAPEQAMGLPSFRSDVFSAALVIYRMLAGAVPEWPFDWPPPGHHRLRRIAHADLIALLKRSLSVQPKRRFKDATQMLAAFRRLESQALSPSKRHKRGNARNGRNGRRHWTEVRFKQFRLEHGRALGTSETCSSCEGPMSEAMQACPWCGRRQRVFKAETSFPAACTRCKRGMKLDWRFCPWCYGEGYEPWTERELGDKRYTAKCSNPACDRKLLMPFMRYCPWCRRKVTRKWRIAGSTDRCSSCGWGVLLDFWQHCPWCTRKLQG